MALTTFSDVQTFITGVLAANGDSGLIGAAGCPHHDFWNSMNYTAFTTGNVPGVVDQNNSPVKILTAGNSATSALIQLLSGTGIAGPAGFFNQMPDGGTAFTAAQIQEIADWIDRGCPQ